MPAAARQRYLEALGLRDFLREAPSVAEAPAAPAPQSRQSVRAERPAAGPPSAGRQAVPAPAPAPATEAPAPAVSEPEPVPQLDSLEEARRCVAECQRCALAGTRTQTVFGVGAEAAPLMIVGEGPGAEEDRRGEPFVGRAGQLLDAMLAAIGHSRGDNTYIANVVKCRPPNNRDPQPQEVAACRPFLDTQIRLIKPKLILAVGRVAAQRLLDTAEPLARLRGDVHYYSEARVPVWVSYHPAYLLRSPHEKAKAWQDLKRVHALLAGDGDGSGS